MGMHDVKDLKVADASGKRAILPKAPPIEPLAINIDDAAAAIGVGSTLMRELVAKGPYLLSSWANGAL
jgi:hypothetical protein